MKQEKITIISDDTKVFNDYKEKLNRIEKLKKENEYDSIILNFYQDGIFIIDGKKTGINEVNIISIKKENDIDHLIDFLNSDTPLPLDLNIVAITKYKNASLFAELMNKYKDKINDNILVFDDEMKNFLFNTKWDGEYHTLTTEAHELYLSTKQSN